MSEPLFTVRVGTEHAEADDEAGALLAVRTLRADDYAATLLQGRGRAEADIYYRGRHVMRIAPTQTV